MTVDEFPIEIRHLMMYRQKEQKGKKDWSEFQKWGVVGGFIFEGTPENFVFWNNVIFKEEFDVFYAKYPKVNYPKDMPEEIIMLALDRRVEQGWPNRYILGFVWTDTPEKAEFWNDINNGIYKVYYEKYGRTGTVLVKPYNPCVEIPLSTVSLSYGGEIADFPPEIVEMMLQRQFKQTGERDVSVFKRYRSADKNQKGFNWNETSENSMFWYEVITEKKFDVFFKKYPKEFNSHIKTKQNEKGNTTSNTAIKVQRPVATISTGKRLTTSGVSGRRSSTAIASRCIGYQTVTGL
jgi:hypothetical protein